MTPQPCPECRAEAFTWTGETGNLGRWRCHHCLYEAQEEDVKEIRCPRCRHRSLLTLRDEKKTYEWCPLCRFARPLLF